jgi:hypothetical protein
MMFSRGRIFSRSSSQVIRLSRLQLIVWISVRSRSQSFIREANAIGVGEPGMILQNRALAN